MLVSHLVLAQLAVDERGPGPLDEQLVARQREQRRRGQRRDRWQPQHGRLRPRTVQRARREEPTPRAATPLAGSGTLDHRNEAHAQHELASRQRGDVVDGQSRRPRVRDLASRTTQGRGGVGRRTRSEREGAKHQASREVTSIWRRSPLPREISTTTPVSRAAPFTAAVAPPAGQLHLTIARLSAGSAGCAWWLKVENPQLWASLRRAPEAMVSFQAAQAALWGA